MASQPAAKAVTTIAPPVATKEVAGHPSPAAAKIMRENGLSASDVSGTGKDGRITKADAAQASANKKAVPATPVAKAQPATAPLVGTSGSSRGTERKKMSRMRRTIAKNLLAAKHESAMLTTFNEVDLTNILSLIHI